MHPDASGAHKELLFKVARRSAGCCESCRKVTTIKFYSPIEGLPTEDLALMLCAVCVEVLDAELKKMPSVAMLKQRIASLLGRAST